MNPDNRTPSALTRVNLQAADMTCASVDESTVFEEVRWSDTTCPDGVDSDDVHGEHCLDHLVRDENVCGE